MNRLEGNYPVDKPTHLCYDLGINRAQKWH